jgi:DNA polymerase III sliding clamp (beta) subunit (PCNA family)
MKINKAELQKALEIVRPALASKELLEQSTSFAFIDDRVVTYNDEISISHPVPNMKLTGAIKATKLYGFLSKVSAKEIGLQIKDNQVKMVAGKSKAGLAIQNEIRLPLDEEIGTIGKWKPLPENFIKALKFTFPNCSQDMTEPILTCVHIPKTGRMEATDRTRIAIYQIDKMPVPNFLLPNTSARELVKYKVIECARGKGWIHFKTKDDTIISCRTYEGEFIDTKPICEVEGAEINFPKESSEAIQRAQVFSDAEHTQDEWIELQFVKGQMTVKSESGEDWFEEPIKCDFEGDPVIFRTVPSFLNQILPESKECIKGENALKFSGENWEYIMALENVE